MNTGRSKNYFGVGICLGGFVLFFYKVSIRLLHYPDTDLLCNFELFYTRTEFRITEGNYASLVLMYH